MAVGRSGWGEGTHKGCPYGGMDRYKRKEPRGRGSFFFIGSIGVGLLEEGFEFFGGLSVFGFFFLLRAVGDGGEFVGAFGLLVAVGAVGCVEGVA